MKARKLPFTELTPIEISRFWAKVVKGDSDQCWIWLKSITPSGYGMLSLRGDQWVCTRICWLIVHGKDPHPLFVLHRCDNRKCVNPAHLFLGTNFDNSIDRMKKNRSAKKLNPDQVREIKSLLSQGKVQRNIGLKFSVCQDTIGKIFRGQTWRFI